VTKHPSASSSRPLREGEKNQCTCHPPLYMHDQIQNFRLAEVNTLLTSDLRPSDFPSHHLVTEGGRAKLRVSFSPPQRKKWHRQKPVHQYTEQQPRSSSSQKKVGKVEKTRIGNSHPAIRLAPAEESTLKRASASTSRGNR
jgi:hypothetical protein